MSLANFKYLNVFFTLLILASLSSNVFCNTSSRENDVFVSIENWILILNYEEGLALAYVNPLKGDEERPQLDLSCYPPNKGMSYDMSLLKTGGLNTKDQTMINISVQVDDNSPFSLSWVYYNKDRVITTSPSWLTKEMINGESFHIKYNDKEGVKKYSYNLQGLEDALDMMHEVCGYKYDGT